MIRYLDGDATVPTQNNALITHVCNNWGGWGAGFVLAISKKWPEPEQAYRDWYKRIEDSVPQEREGDEFALGNVQFVPVFDHNYWVANMIAQDGFHKKNDPDDKVYVDYDALNTTLGKVCKFAKKKGLSLHMPRIGCGLAGGKWDLIEPLLQTHSNENDVDVYVYDFD